MQEGGGESVLDYVIGDEEVWEKVNRIRVEERIESDPFPVVVGIKGGEEREGRKGNGRGKMCVVTRREESIQREVEEAIGGLGGGEESGMGGSEE